MSADERKLYLYLGRILSGFEQNFVLQQRQWMDREDAKATWYQLNEIVALPAFKAWWTRLRPYYRDDFGSFVDSIAATAKQA